MPARWHACRPALRVQAYLHPLNTRGHACMPTGLLADIHMRLHLHMPIWPHHISPAPACLHASMRARLYRACAPTCAHTASLHAHMPLPCGPMQAREQAAMSAHRHATLHIPLRVVYDLYFDLRFRVARLKFHSTLCTHESIEAGASARVRKFCVQCTGRALSSPAAAAAIQGEGGEGARGRGEGKGRA